MNYPTASGSNRLQRKCMKVCGVMEKKREMVPLLSKTNSLSMASGKTA